MDSWESMGGWGALEDKPAIKQIRIGGISLQAGDRVRLRPLQGADIFDIALAGKIATIETILQDYEEKVYVAVTVDDDPGKDLGFDRKPGHRFFFSPLEIEPLSAEEQTEQ